VRPAVNEPAFADFVWPNCGPVLTVATAHRYLDALRGRRGAL